MDLESELESSQEKCGGDVFRQRVPDSSSGDGKSQSSTLVSWVRLTISDEDELKRSS